MKEPSRLPLIGHLVGMMCVVCGLLAALLLVQLVSVDLPLIFGAVYGDFPDPDRPGHLRGVVVGRMEVMGKIGAMVALAFLAVLAYRYGRRLDDPSCG